MHHDDHDHDHDHDQGLAHDLHQWQRGLSRRRWALGALGALAALGGSSRSGRALAQAQAGAAAARCSVIPDETAGPFPANGAGRFGAGINALALSGIVRSDIRSSLAGASAVAAGVPLTLTLKLVNAAGSCQPLAGLAVYLWQCDREGRYSMYSPGARDENYLRGVQAAGADGSVSFSTVFPGCYPGRMPHLHFEVYRSFEPGAATTQRVKTSQLALPPEVCERVYAEAAGYGDSVANLGRISFATDGVFRDGVEHQLATLRGSPSAGYVAQLGVGLRV